MSRADIALWMILAVVFAGEALVVAVASMFHLGTGEDLHAMLQRYASVFFYARMVMNAFVAFPFIGTAFLLTLSFRRFLGASTQTVTPVCVALGVAGVVGAAVVAFVMFTAL